MQNKTANFCWFQEDDEPEVAGVFVQANQEELSKRVIKKAKRRGAGNQGVSKKTHLVVECF